MTSLARNLIKSEKIQTTTAKAKELRPMIEKLVTKAKTDTLASRRLVTARLRSTSDMKKLFDTIAPKYKTRTGGYTRIVKLPNRDLDGAPMALIEFV